jgi:hypothetical protein
MNNKLNKSYSELYQIDDNKEAHDKLNLHRKDLIIKLSKFLEKGNTDKKIIIAGLRDLEFETEEGFENKTIDKIRDSIFELMEYLELISSNSLIIDDKTNKNGLKKNIFQEPESIVNKKRDKTSETLNGKAELTKKNPNEIFGKEDEILELIKIRASEVRNDKLEKLLMDNKPNNAKFTINKNIYLKLSMTTVQVL